MNAKGYFDHMFPEKGFAVIGVILLIVTTIVAALVILIIGPIFAVKDFFSKDK